MINENKTRTPRKPKRTAAAANLHGWINFYKPPGLSSNQCLTKIKYLLGRPKIGHAGTLDPLAFGVLPVALGEATKVTSYLLGAPKTYRFEITWGQQRTTDDADGEVMETSLKRPTLQEIQAVMPYFQGEFEQLPPTFSAKKIQGRPSYALARKGHDVELKHALINVTSLELIEHRGDTSEFMVTCSKGTYVRAIARDMGLRLSCYGYASLIERRQVGPFDINSSISLEKLEIAEKTSIVDQILIPLQAVLDDIPAVLVTPIDAQRLRQGQGVDRRNISFNGEPVDISSVRVAIYESNTLIALAELKEDQLMPVRVFNLI